MKEINPYNNNRFKFIILILLLMFGVIVVGVAAQEDATVDDVPEPQIIEQVEEPGVVNTIKRIDPSKDAFVSSNLPYNNFGGWADMRSGRDDTYGATRTLIQFDFGSIPSGSIINRADLYLYQTASIPGDDSDFLYGGRYMASSWDEYTVNWSNHAPDWNDNDLFGSANINGAIGWKVFNIKDEVNTWISGQRPNNGMLIQSSNENAIRERIFASRQNTNSTLRPYIVVDYTEYVDTCPPNAWFTSILPQYSPASFTVSWDGSDCGSNGNPPSGIRNYDVQYSYDNYNWINWKMDTQDKSGTFHGSNGQRLFFRVRAADNALNLGAWSSSIDTTVDSIAPTPLSLNIAPTITEGGNDYVFPHFEVSWSASDNLSGIQKYIVQWNDNAGSGWQSREFASNQKNEFVNGADVGKTYSFRMQAVDNAGNVSDWLDATPSPVTVVNDPDSVVLPFDDSIIDSMTFLVKWAGFTSTSIEGFTVKYQVDGGAWQDWIIDETFTSATFDASSLFEDTPPYGKAKIIGFEVSATATDLPQEPFLGVAEATIVVDPDDTLNNKIYMPIVRKD